ncbi:MAG: choice-of-anchor tandem repeat GloVer-containing protein [Candidatus Sulfotelmatobacter sp.]
MKSRIFPFGSYVAFTALAATALMAATPAFAQTEDLLFSFTGSGEHGSAPVGGLIFDAAGNLYGTTILGGEGVCGSEGCGTAFELMPNAGGGWTQKVLHSFHDNGKDGLYPVTSLIFDATGNLYGTTENGGSHAAGTVFELTPGTGGNWTEKILHNFGAGSDGTAPEAALIFDAAGNLYGTTSGGGAHVSGTVFELSPTTTGWTEKILHSFAGYPKDGDIPAAGLIFDAAGNLYGTTFNGGKHSNCPYGDCGTVFELTPATGGV